MADRYVVRELTGWAIHPDGNTRRSAPRTPAGLTVWVADDQRHGLEVRVWRSEDYGAMWRPFKHRRMRDEAQALADDLNRQEATR